MLRNATLKSVGLLFVDIYKSIRVKARRDKRGTYVVRKHVQIQFTYKNQHLSQAPLMPT